MIPELQQDFAEGSIGYWIKQQSNDWQEVIIQRMKDSATLGFLTWQPLKAPMKSPIASCFGFGSTFEKFDFWSDLIYLGYDRIPFSYDFHCKKHKVGKYAEQAITFAPVTTTATIDGKEYTLEINIKATPNG